MLLTQILMYNAIVSADGKQRRDEPSTTDETKEIQEKESQTAETLIKTEDEVLKIKKTHFSNSRPEEFSSENFKLEIGGLPHYYSLGHFKKLLNNVLHLDAHKIKPGGLGRNVAFVNFKDEQARTNAKLALNGHNWQNSTLSAIDAVPAKDPVMLKKIKYLTVKEKEFRNLSLPDRITKAVAPYHNLSYEEQIKEKDKVVKNIMNKFGSELRQVNPELKEFVKWHKMRRRGQICEMDDFVKSPAKEGYRNKCEFTIGQTQDSTDPVVGFRMASYKEGSVEVGPIDHLKHINSQMKTVAKCMENFIKTSGYEVFQPFSHSGVWRQLTVRTSNNGDVMIIVVMHPQDMNEETLQEIKKDLVTYFSSGPGAEAFVTSIYVQVYGQKERDQTVEFEHLWGKRDIEETILGKTYIASPDAFLQVNTAACELLYSKVSDIAEIDEQSVVLDVCCGVGTIGLSTAEKASKVYGVELNEKAVVNARLNASRNNITNAVFFHGKAEDYIDNMIERSNKGKTVAIIDPPRAGLHGCVMNAMRKCEYLERLIYISCDPQAAIGNFISLCRPRSKTYKGSFFVPVRAVPVDLFPDTPHFELIIVFERYNECKWSRILAGNPRPKDQEYFDRAPPLNPDEDDEDKNTKNNKRTNSWDGDKSKKRNKSDQQENIIRGTSDDLKEEQNNRYENIENPSQFSHSPPSNFSSFQSPQLSNENLDLRFQLLLNRNLEMARNSFHSHTNARESRSFCTFNHNNIKDYYVGNESTPLKLNSDFVEGYEAGLNAMLSAVTNEVFTWKKVKNKLNIIKDLNKQE